MRATGSDPRAGMSTLHLVGDARIAKVVRARESATAGQVSVPCSPRGQTPSYAVLLVGPGAGAAVARGGGADGAGFNGDR